jgi:hypothetical protein
MSTIFFTIVEIILPSAVPPNCADANPIYFDANTCRSSFNNFLQLQLLLLRLIVQVRIFFNAICANSGSAKSKRFCSVKFLAFLAGFTNL